MYFCQSTRIAYVLCFPWEIEINIVLDYTLDFANTADLLEVELRSQEPNGFPSDCWCSEHAQANGGP